MEFVVQGNHAFSTVEEAKFKVIISKGFPNRRCLTRKTLMSRINYHSAKLREALKLKLTSTAVKHVCVTADCWSVYKRFVISNQMYTQTENVVNKYSTPKPILFICPV